MMVQITILIHCLLLLVMPPLFCVSHSTGALPGQMAAAAAWLRFGD
jgi:hypothetical protein